MRGVILINNSRNINYSYYSFDFFEGRKVLLSLPGNAYTLVLFFDSSASGIAMGMTRRGVYYIYIILDQGSSLSAPDKDPPDPVPR